MLFALLGLHAVLALAAPLLARRLGRGVFLACAAAPAATVAWAAARAPAILAGRPVEQAWQWAPSLGVSAGLRLDAFGLLMVALVSGIGVLVFVYAYGYFSRPRPDLGPFAASLTGFAGAMLGLVLADNLLLLFVFWELTSITSFLLIGFEDREKPARDAAVQALLITGGGGLAMLGGIVIVGQVAGTYALSELAGAVGDGGGGLLSAGLVLVLVGAFTKSAQVPFHSWLPGAMAAPTPVSAYLHSATMVKAGVYVVARLAPVFAVVSPWRPLVIAVGLATMFLGAYRALRQHDLKLLLAYGTVSQLGFMVVLFGLGTAHTTFAGAGLLLAHGLFKAALFMVVGVVDKKAGTRDLRRLPRLYPRMPGTVLAGTVAAASMAGLPPLFGFIAKESAYEALTGGAGLGATGWLVLVGVVAGSVLTFAYSARFVLAVWGRGGRAAAEAAVPPERVGRPARVFAGPAVLLAVATVVFGLLPLAADALVNAAAVALDPRWEPEHLALWHGLNLALALSGLTVAAGGGLVLLRHGVERIQGAVQVPASSQGTYEASVRGLLGGAKRLTGVVQNGSLPVYLGVILLTAVALPAAALARVGLPASVLTWSPMHAVVGAFVAALALGTVAVPRRFPAVLLLGGVGFGIGLLFVLHGAPDLALTQVLIETLALVIFVLVLRHLPDRFEVRHSAADRVVRGVIAGAVGLFVFAFALVAAGARRLPPVSAEYVQRALPEAGGRNIVNVILVDFRALDTLGEITVLAIAAMGIASLVAASRLEAPRPLWPRRADDQETVDEAGGRRASS